MKLKHPYSPLALAVSVAVLATLTLLTSIKVAMADHSWGGFHWARTTSSFNLKLGDSLTSAWDSYLDTSSNDWSISSVLNTSIVAGKNTRNPRACRATPGMVEICNARFGTNGWLGIANVWVTGNHITQGTVKLNDTYFSMSNYNTPAWKNLVMCQEIGHTFGLDHQDENFGNANLGTCMDYTSNPTSNQHPNAHDYEQLEEIYAHLDTTSTVSSGTAASQRQDQPSTSRQIELDLSDPSSWGETIRRYPNGKPSVFLRSLSPNEKVFTFVVWVDEIEATNTESTSPEPKIPTVKTPNTRIPEIWLPPRLR